MTHRLLTCLVLTAFLGLLAGTAPADAAGPRMDPDGLQAHGEAGPGMDPNGLQAHSEAGPQMDPNG